MKRSTRSAALIGAAVVAVSFIGPAAQASGLSSEESEVSFVATPEARALAPVDEEENADALIAEDGFVVTFELDEQDVVQQREIALVRHASDVTDDDRPATFVASSDGSVSLKWHDVSNGEVEWSVSRDGDLLGTTRGGSFTDRRPLNGDTSEYRIEGMRTLEINGRTAEQPFLIVLDVPAVDTDSVGKRIDASSRSAAENSDVITAQAAQLTVIDQQLNTFIPDFSVSGPFDQNICLQTWLLQPGTLLRFAGDNRSFAGPTDESPSVRTGVSATYRFQGQTAPYAAFGTRTSGTRLLDSAGNTVSQMNSNLNLVRRIGDAGDFTSRESTWNHEAVDPLCALADPIDYELTFGASQNNWITLRGWHEQAPSYEFRTKWRSGPYVGTWKNVYTFQNKGFEYLFEIWPKAYVDIYRQVAQ